jgi:hypothetical protein
VKAQRQPQALKKSVVPSSISTSHSIREAQGRKIEQRNTCVSGSSSAIFD